MTFSPNDLPPPGAPDRRIGPAPRGDRLCFTFDGQPVTAYEGETVAAALLAAGRRAFRLTNRGAEPRGLFCGMGLCFDCLVRVDGRPNVRACQTPAAEGMRVETQRGAGSWEAPP
jgi:predicted molibdopterin-dependent oxidoreductase YjgC